MSRTLYGFSICDQSHEGPFWFYHKESAENYARENGPDWMIEEVSEDDVDPEDILDTEGSVWKHVK
jgi:hypothetical protein